MSYGLQHSVPVRLPATDKQMPWRRESYPQETAARRKPLFNLPLGELVDSCEKGTGVPCSNGHVRASPLTPPIELDAVHWSEDDSLSEMTSLEATQTSASGSVVDRPLHDNTIDEAVTIAVESLAAKHSSTTAFKVVSQILPSPIQELKTETDSIMAEASILGNLIGSLRAAGGSSKWVCVIHAMPESSGVKEMPTSPQTTPGAGRQIQGDYFGEQKEARVISNVSIMINRHDIFNQARAISGPGFATPPSTADVSLYQRLIPPASVEEFQDLFEAKRPSALVDRLSELAPMGNLIFIYPTKAGAETFQQHYLNPTLDSLIRRVVYRNDLPPSICAALSRMPSALHMLSFENLQRKLESLTQQLQPGSPTAAPSYATIFAKRYPFKLNDTTWKQWFVQQEASRIRHIMEGCVQRTAARPRFKDEHLVTARSLAREMLDSLLTSEGSAESSIAGSGSSATDTVEVGVFVVKRFA